MTAPVVFILCLALHAGVAGCLILHRRRRATPPAPPPTHPTNCLDP